MNLQTIVSDPLMALVWALAVLYGIAVHECTHAALAVAMGDRTPEEQGRLTLNPFAHLDLTGLLFLILIGFGWGKPVEFNPYNLRYQRWGPALIAIGGPVVNLLSAIVFGVALRILFPTLGGANTLVLFLQGLVMFNVVLGVFNLLPLAPLDGSKLLRALLPDRFHHAYAAWERAGTFILLGILVLDFLTPIHVFRVLFLTVLSWIGQFVNISF